MTWFKSMSNFITLKLLLSGQPENLNNREGYIEVIENKKIRRGFDFLFFFIK